MATFIPFDLMFNHAGKLRHMTGGQAAFPMVLWADMARRDPFQGGQHAEAGLESCYARLAGLKVVVPSTPYDAKGLMLASIRDPNPICFVEHKVLYKTKGEVPEHEYTIPIGVAEIKRPGRDITVVANNIMVNKTLNVAERLAKEGIEVEVIDPRTLLPLDTDTIINSVARTVTPAGGP